uniref:Uncharacterized protein n=1 Tax=Arundo donax TaxID=35708 RepID=A0A0A9CGZ7_ARUDO
MGWYEPKVFVHIFLLILLSNCGPLVSACCFFFFYTPMWYLLCDKLWLCMSS